MSTKRSNDEQIAYDNAVKEIAVFLKEYPEGEEALETWLEAAGSLRLYQMYGRELTLRIFSEAGMASDEVAEEAARMDMLIGLLLSAHEENPNTPNHEH